MIDRCQTSRSSGPHQPTKPTFTAFSLLRLPSCNVCLSSCAEIAPAPCSCPFLRHHARHSLRCVLQKLTTQPLHLSERTISTNLNPVHQGTLGDCFWRVNGQVVRRLCLGSDGSWWLVIPVPVQLVIRGTHSSTMILFNDSSDLQDR
jgi:hypothetical protein